MYLRILEKHHLEFYKLQRCNEAGGSSTRAAPNVTEQRDLYIPVLCHNLSCGQNIFFSELMIRYNQNVDSVNRQNLKLLPNHTDNFQSLLVGNLNFLDTLAFMSCGSGKLIDDLPGENKYYSRHISKTEYVLEITNMQGQFPYEWFDNIDKLKVPNTD